MTTRYREIEVSGTHLEIGRQIGEAAREEIRGFAAIALERVNKTIPVSRENALATCRDSIPYIEAYSPDLLAELRGMQEGSGWTPESVVDHAFPAMSTMFYPLDRSADIFSWDPV